MWLTLVHSVRLPRPLIWVSGKCPLTSRLPTSMYLSTWTTNHFSWKVHEVPGRSLSPIHLRLSPIWSNLCLSSCTRGCDIRASRGLADSCSNVQSDHSSQGLSLQVENPAGILMRRWEPYQSREWMDQIKESSQGFTCLFLAYR